MCDFSLEVYGAQPAREGERYETSRFPSGTIGLVVPARPMTAVCLACDTRLEIDGIPADLRKAHGLKATEYATFVRLETGAYRDGLHFDNGAEMSFQRLPPGVGVTALGLLASLDPVEMEQRESHYLGA